MKFPCSGVSIVVAAALSSGCSAPAPTAETLPEVDERNRVRVGPNVEIPSQFTGLPLVEPHVSAHPVDANRLLAAAMVVTDVNRPYESCRLTSFVSTDGGETWKETPHDFWGYDPWTEILPDGRAVLAWIGTRGSFQDLYPIALFTSADGGATFGPEPQTLPGNHDGTKLAALGTTVYFSTVFFKEHMDVDVRLYKSSDGGPFEMVSAISGSGERLAFAEPAVLTDGTVVLPASLFQQKAWVQRSEDGGRTLSVVVTTALGGGKGYYHLAADRSESRFKDRLYFVRANGYEDEFHGIWLNASSDEGRTWSSDRRVDSFETPAKSCAMTPTVAVNRDGALGITWMDCHEDPAGKKMDLYFAVSVDGGERFQRPVRVTDASSDPRTPANADVANKFPGGGHYLGLAARADGAFQAVWSDSRGGLYQLRTAKVVVVE